MGLPMIADGLPAADSSQQPQGSSSTLPPPPGPEAASQGGPSAAAASGASSAAAAAAAGVPVSGALERRLGLLDLILLGIGASIGSGIFVVTGIAAKSAGPSVVLSFAIAGMASVLDALCYAELSARFPGLVGGAYLYTYAAFGELGAFCLFCHLMFDYHIGAASIARSLASYLSSLAQAGLGPALPLPPFIAPGGLSLLGGALSVNLLAPAILLAITWLLCRGVRESASVNGALTSVKVVIVLIVAVTGATLVQPQNWVPFAPNGGQATLAAASVVFFSYIGFDAVANTAEESKNPQRDVPLGILISLTVCCLLYIAVCLVLTGMVPYSSLDPSAPLSAAFAARGYLGLEAFIDLGAVVGLTTTLVAGLYVQARLYLAIARDGLLPSALARVTAAQSVTASSSPSSSSTDGDNATSDEHHQSQQSHQQQKQHHAIPLNAQMWVGMVAAVLGAFFDVSRLSHVLSVGVLVSYSLVCVCVPILRLSAFFQETLPPPPAQAHQAPDQAAQAAETGHSSTEINTTGVPEGVNSASKASKGEGSYEYQSLQGGTPSNSSSSHSTSPLASFFQKDQGTHAGSSSRHARTPASSATVLPTRGGSTMGLGSVAASMRWRALVAVSLLAALSLILGLVMRFFSPSLALPLSLLLLLCMAAAASQLAFLPSHSLPPPGFSCPAVPWLPILGMLVNVYLISQMHPAAWLRLVLVTAVALLVFFEFERGRPRERAQLCSAAVCSGQVAPAATGGAESDPLLQQA